MNVCLLLEMRPASGVPAATPAAHPASAGRRLDRASA
jgi:hypothetical protein